MKPKPIAITSAILAAVLFAGWAATRSATSAPSPEVPSASTPSSTTAPASPALVSPRQTSSAPAPTPASLQEIPRIDAATLQARMARNEVVVIDVRDIDSYTTLHIAGAMHIPLSRIEGEVPWLRLPKPIVTYCT